MTRPYGAVLQGGKTGEKLSVLDYISIIFAVYMMSGSSSDLYMYIGAALFLLWIAVGIFTEFESFSKIIMEKTVILLLIFSVFMFLQTIQVGGYVRGAKQAMSILINFSPLFIFLYYKTSGYIERLKKVLLATLCGWAYFCFVALFFYEQYEDAARNMAGGTDEYGVLAIGGGYALAYGSAILCVFLLSLRISKKHTDIFDFKGNYVKIIYKFIFWTYILLTFFLVIETKSTMTIIFMIVGLVICIAFFPNKINEAGEKVYSTRNVISLFIVAISVIGLTIYTKEIGQFIVDITKDNVDDVVFNRLHGMGSYLVYGDDYGSTSFQNRLNLPLASLSVFLDNPIFGVGHLHGNGHFHPSLFGIGNHCEWADILGNYGLIFGGILLYVYSSVIFKKKNDSERTVSSAWKWSYVGLGLFNPFLSFNSILIVFFVIPAVFLIIDENKKHKKS